MRVKADDFFKGIGRGVFYLARIIINNMIKEKILVIGASGQIGVELTLALRKIYGNANVVASDLREENDLLRGYQNGANSYIVKPVDSFQFEASIQQLGLYWLGLNESPNSGRGPH